MKLFTSHSGIAGLLTLILFAGGCSKEKDNEPVAECGTVTSYGTLEINFVAGYGADPFFPNTDYYTAYNQRIQVQDFKFLASEFWTKNTSGDSVYLREAFKFDQNAHRTSLSVSLPAGDYTGLGFALGVVAYKDTADPMIVFPSGDFSLGVASDMHWAWSDGYIFAMFGGVVDTSAGGNGSLNNTFTFHVGHPNLYSPLPFFAKNFSVTNGGTTVVNIHVDLYSFLHSSTDSIDFRIDRVTQTNDNYPLAQRFMQMYKQSFSIP